MRMTTQTDVSDARSTGASTDTLIDRWIRAPLATLSFWSGIVRPVFYYSVER